MGLAKGVARVYWRFSKWTEVIEPFPQNGAVLLGVPHTSNWDFVLMLAIAWDNDVPLKWLGKSSLFKGPFGPIMRALGGIPVDRSGAHGLVDQVVAMRNEKGRFFIVVTPEGTRGKGDYWKSGFYRIARGADLPVVLGWVDRTTMTTGLGPTVNLTGDVSADMDVIRDFYADKVGINDALTTPPRLREEDEPSA